MQLLLKSSRWSGKVQLLLKSSRWSGPQFLTTYNHISYLTASGTAFLIRVQISWFQKRAPK